MIDIESKYALLRKITPDASVRQEILNYIRNKFNVNPGASDFDTHSLSAAFIPAWEKYLGQSKIVGIWETLKSHLVQLQFPIQKHISLSEEYRAATLKGKCTLKMSSASGLQLKNSDSLQLEIYESIVGKIPVLIVPDHEDFCSLIQALSYKNEPVIIPDSMGAALINGINNWSRINEMKASWTANNPLGNWSTEFMTNVSPYKPLYQDRLIVLSKINYSGISPEKMGFTSKQWLNHSFEIRLEHECTHLFTLIRFGRMANNMHDELLADYMGISKVLGKFSANWFLKFLGLEEYPTYRQGARFENYLGNPPISAKGFEVLKTIVKQAAENVALFDNCLGATNNRYDRVARLTTLCSFDLLEISSETGLKDLLWTYRIQIGKNGQ